MLGLYLHIPFCQAICSYCNFARGLYDADLSRRYVDALEREIVEAGDGRPADTIFFGGGTPSMLEPSAIKRLIDACRDAYTLDPRAEITLETNPETVTEDRLSAFLAAGVNRISVGVQSFNDEELLRLGRVHSAARAVAALAAARRVGCNNVSLDLMLWLPGQTLASWRRTVESAILAQPDHMSLYMLELYPNAPLKEAMARVAVTPSREAVAWAQAAEDEAADMYLEGLGMLDDAGFSQYEISNVALPGRRSQHNLKYWQSGAWRGFGCGAHSTMDSRRWRNVASAAEYVERASNGRSAVTDFQLLEPAGRIEEALFTGLRLSEGIDCGAFEARYGLDPWVRYGSSLVPCVGDGLIWREGRRFGLTRRGMLVANEILVTFLEDTAATSR